MSDRLSYRRVYRQISDDDGDEADLDRELRRLACERVARAAGEALRALERRQRIESELLVEPVMAQADRGRTPIAGCRSRSIWPASFVSAVTVRLVLGPLGFRRCDDLPRAFSSFGPRLFFGLAVETGLARSTREQKKRRGGRFPASFGGATA